MQCCQIALSTMDLVRSRWWYQQSLGFVPVGEARHREGQIYADVPGLPEASFDVACVVGRQTFAQIEMFEFARPRMRPRPATWRPCDIGYSMFGIHVPDFDAALRRLQVVGGTLMTAPIGKSGCRRVCLLDPDGILIELMEDDPMGSLERRTTAALPAIACVTVSVFDLDEARACWTGAFGFEQARSNVLHGAEHEQLWGIPGATRETLVLRTGTIGLELVRYSSPAGRSRPAGYMLSDQGILNIALGSTDRLEFDAYYRRALEHGFRANREPWELPGIATVVYLRDTQGFSVELLHVEPHSLERMGFMPSRRTMSDRHVLDGRIGKRASAQLSC